MRSSRSPWASLRIFASLREPHIEDLLIHFRAETQSSAKLAGPFVVYTSARSRVYPPDFQLFPTARRTCANTVDTFGYHRGFAEYTWRSSTNTLNSPNLPLTASTAIRYSRFNAAATRAAVSRFIGQTGQYLTMIRGIMDTSHWLSSSLRTSTSSDRYRRNMRAAYWRPLR